MWAPAMPGKSFSCSCVGPVIRKASAMPAMPISAPARIARVRARSPTWLRNRMTATTRAVSQTTAMEVAMTLHIAVVDGVATLKWLVTPTAASPVMMTISMVRATVATVPAIEAARRSTVSWPISQERVTA
ncbi:MAG: hypothetical protein JWP66_1578 [Naasia sp.]|nr:hypothetical protein [Naasia sp.]